MPYQVLCLDFLATHTQWQLQHRGGLRQLRRSLCSEDFQKYSLWAATVSFYPIELQTYARAHIACQSSSCRLGLRFYRKFQYGTLKA